MPPKKKTRADILAGLNKKYADKFSIGFQSNAQFLDTGNITLNHLIGAKGFKIGVTGAQAGSRNLVVRARVATQRAA